MHLINASEACIGSNVGLYYLNWISVRRCYLWSDASDALISYTLADGIIILQSTGEVFAQSRLNMAQTFIGSARSAPAHSSTLL